MNFSNGIIKNCDTAIFSSNGEVIIDNVDFTSNTSYALNSSNSSIGTIQNCNINNNQETSGSFYINDNILSNNINYALNVTNNNNKYIKDGINGNSNSTIMYNEIFDNGDDGIESSGLPTINYNDLYGNTGFNVHATKELASSESIDAENNWWGTNVESEIETSIFDFYDDGITVPVDYEPWQPSSFIPVAPEANNAIVCFNSSYTLIATGINLKWYENDNYTVLLAEGETYTPPIIASGIYTYYVSQTINGHESYLNEITLTGTAPWNFIYTDGTTPEEITTSDNPYIFTILSSGTYSVIAISDANCDGIDFGNSATVEINPLPTANITSGDVTMCEGETTDMSIVFTGTAPFVFTYTDGITPEEITTSENPYLFTVSTAGTYTVTTLSDINCTGINFGNSANITVNPLPTADITTGDQTICGEETNISIALTGTEQWTFTYTDGTTPEEITTSTNPHILTISSSATYSITAISDENCTGTDFGNYATIVINPLPTANIISSNAMCEGETTDISIDLTGTAPFEFIYTDGTTPIEITTSNNSYTYTISTAGTYTVTALSDINCTGLDFGNGVAILINPLPEINDIIKIDETDCVSSDRTILISAEGNTPIKYSIDGGTAYFENGGNFTNLTTGNYKVAVKDVNSCEFFGEIVNLTNIAPATSAIELKGERVLICVDSGYVYQWYRNNEIIENATEQFYYNGNEIPGNYHVQIFDVNNCSNKTQVYVYQTPTKNIELSETIKIYPNPSTGIFTFEIDNEYICDVKYSIKNYLGQTYETSFISKKGVFYSEQKSFTNLLPGLYYVEFIFEDNKQVTKLLIIK